MPEERERGDDNTSQYEYITEATLNVNNGEQRFGFKASRRLSNSVISRRLEAESVPRRRHTCRSLVSGRAPDDPTSSAGL